MSSPVQFVKPVHVQTVVNCAHFNTRSDQFPGDYYTLLMSLLCYEELIGNNNNEEMSIMEIIADEETTKEMIETKESIKEIIETEELTK